MNIAELQKEIHKTAREKGWWDNERTPGEIYALIHSEISEAVECARNGEPPVWYNSEESKKLIYGENQDYVTAWSIKDFPQNGEKPQGELIELADVVIRILDYAESRGYKLKSAYQHEKVCFPNRLNFYMELHAYISDAYGVSAKVNESESEVLHDAITFVDGFCKNENWDLWKAVRCKMGYNKTREHRHGGKRY